MPSNPPLKMGGKIEPEFNGSAPKQDADGAAEGEPRSDRAHNQSQTLPVPFPPVDKSPVPQKEGNYQTRESQGERTEFFYFAGYRLKVTDSLVALFTGLLVLVGGIQAYRLRQTVLATREAAGALPAIERAYLFLFEEIGQTVTDNRTADTPFGEGEYTFSLEYAFHNYGKTPAIIEGLAASIRYFSAQPTEYPDAIAAIPIGFLVGADAGSRGWDVSKRIGEYHYDLAREGDGYILFTGRVSYCDILKRTWETGFCLEYNWERKRFVVSPNRHLNYRT
jgi:hypothetical protein